jgi:hypothetical protein
VIVGSLFIKVFHNRSCEYFTLFLWNISQTKSFHPSILALQDGSRGPAPLSNIPLGGRGERTGRDHRVIRFVNSLLKEREMKQLQYIITTFSLIVAFTGMSPVVVADAGRPSGGERFQPDSRQIESPLRYKLSTEQMDNIRGGMMDDGNNPSPAGETDQHGGIGCGHISCAGL